MVDLCVVNPNNRNPSPFAAIEPPLWAGMTATYHGGTVLDAEVWDLNIEGTVAAILALNPKKVTIMVMGANPSASSTPKMPVAEALAERLIGLDSTLYPDVQDGRYFDVSLAGLHPNALGSRYKVIKKPFEGVPFMPWHQLPMGIYRAHNWHCFDDLDKRQPYAAIYTSLGCPYNCTYCNVHVLYEPGIHLRPWQDVIREIDRLVHRYNVRNIKIADELFAFNESRIDSICDPLIERGYDLNMWAYARVDTVNEKMLRKMKKTGINWLCYGFESASETVRAGVGKKASQRKTEDAIKMTRDAGINILANFIFGLPDDNLETMEETLCMAKEHLFEYVNFYTAMAYPGSKLYDDAIKRGTPLPKSWSGYGQYSEDCLPLPTKYLSSAEVLRFRDRAFKDYLSNTRYQQMIGAKFGQKAVDHIRELLKHDIRRKFA